jgi:hypothetical protein
MNPQETRTSNTVSAVLSFIMLVIDLFLLGLIAWQTLIFREEFQDIFNKFGVQLPAFTSLLLSVPGKVYLAVATCLAICLLVKELTIANQSIKLGINMVAGVALLVFAALFHLSLLMPWMSMLKMQNLQ